jgi:hypothetical protein
MGVGDSVDLICLRDPLPPVHGARGCPREAGHSGPHYWWLPWEDESGRWRVVVYSGPPEERVKRCRGVFWGEPTNADVNRLLQSIARIRRREISRRTPASEPPPLERSLNVELRPYGKGMMAVVSSG